MLEVHDLCKHFYDPGRGPVAAVDEVDLSAGGGILALVGANGAGKTTLLRLITTLLQPDAGTILVDGIDARRDPLAVRRRIGYLATGARLYPRLSARELLAYAGGFYDLRGADLEGAITRVVATFRLEDFLDQRCDSLSTGQAQRVGLARALLGDPPLLILDEPTTGLDIAAARRVIEAVAACRRAGRLVVIATHIMSEVEELADRLVILDHGHVTFDGAPSTLGSGASLLHAVHRLIGPDEET